MSILTRLANERLARPKVAYPDGEVRTYVPRMGVAEELARERCPRHYQRTERECKS